MKQLNALRNALTVRVMLVVILLYFAAGQAVRLHAHNPGYTQAAPNGSAASLVINGTIAEAAWGVGALLDRLPNNCAEFRAENGPQVTFYALNDGMHLYLAFDVPDSSPQPADSLFLFFSPPLNHEVASPSLALGDKALRLIFNTVNAVDAVPNAERYEVVTPGFWPAPTAGLPAGAVARYTRHTAGAGKWQVELKLPLTFFPITAGATMGAAFLYLNSTGPAGENCDGDPFPDDFYAKFPAALTLVQNIGVLNQVVNPGLWGDLMLGQEVPSVGFQPPLCCTSTDIAFTPATQPFTAGTAVDILARAHNFHPTSTAKNVRLEIRVHNFGTGGGGSVVFSATPVPIPSIAAASGSFSSPVTWLSPPAGLHGCIRAEIKPPADAADYTIAGNSVTQYNIDVASLAPGRKSEFIYLAFNPEPKQEVKIKLIAQQQLPRGFAPMKLELQQPTRPLRPQEELPVRLQVTALANAPITQVPKQRRQVPPTAGGTAIPPLSQRSGTDPITVAVKPGDRLHLSAFGEVDIDGRGQLPPNGPAGQDWARIMPGNNNFAAAQGQRRFLLAGATANRSVGALIGSFDAFKTGFVIGTELTLTVPRGADKLWLAVNDFDLGYGDNVGKGFDVELATLPALLALTGTGIAEAGAIGIGVVKAAEQTVSTVQLPQVNITAVSTARVTAGTQVYNLLTNHGGLTYQFLVTDEKTPAPHGGHGRKIALILLILAILAYLVKIAF